MKTPLDILNDFAKEVEDIVKDELLKIGLSDKYGSGQPVKITNSVKGQVNDFFGVSLEINDYYIWLVRGRRSLAENPSAKPPPFKSIREWVGRRKFQFSDKKGRLFSYDKTAWIVRRAVWVNGVKGRDFVTPSIKRICDLYQKKLADNLFRSVINNLDRNFVIPIIPILTNTKK